MHRLRSTARAHARLLGGVVAIGAAIAMVQLRPHAIAAPVDLAAATLVSAAAGGALFDVTGMVPGRAETRCLDVTLPTPSEASDVLLRATNVSGELAADLTVVVETGPATGGLIGDCAGFRGTEVYRGTLASLASASTVGPFGVDTGWTLTPDTRTLAFRITTEVADVPSAQGTTAVADLVWASVQAPPADGPAPSAGPPASRAAPPVADPAPSTDATERPATGPSGEPSSNASDAPARRPSGARRAGGTATTGPGTPVQDPDPAVRTVLGVSEKLGRTATGTIEQSGFPAALMAVMGIFLVFQDSLDRRDPKLALAPLDDDEDLPFDTGVVR